MRIGWENVRGGYYINKLFGKISALVNEINTVKDKTLPDVTADDNGKTMVVADGEWSLGEGGGGDEYKLVEIPGSYIKAPYYGNFKLYSNGNIVCLSFIVGNPNGFGTEYSTDSIFANIPPAYTPKNPSGKIYSVIPTSNDERGKAVTIQIGSSGEITYYNDSSSTITSMLTGDIFYVI